ncbi:Extracellular matrix regulatory protein A [Eubacterium plexicaudatum ASF492]|uniref:Putative regulatory protein C823_00666 n=1 Tax=Eubacterium plexicaudatum ASF492 TaxID=1235802 RepID=N2BHH8_9FIRM|nr:Extracellular matrix regulatory protein A [Eubacterium plexicaudatum ASF492]
MSKLMNIGFGNVINTDKILCIITPDSAPAKRQIQRAKEENRLIDATQGRRTRAVIFTVNQMLVISALQPDTLSGRFGNEERTPD